MKKIAVSLGKHEEKEERDRIILILCSCIRPNEALKRIFTEAGLTVVKEGIQQGLPAGLFTVRM